LDTASFSIFFDWVLLILSAPHLHHPSLLYPAPPTPTLPSTSCLPTRVNPSSYEPLPAAHHPARERMEFSRLSVPKPPRTTVENLSKRESTYWKSFKVSDRLPSPETAANDPIDSPPSSSSRTPPSPTSPSPPPLPTATSSPRALDYRSTVPRPTKSSRPSRVSKRLRAVER
jgi:hypothetical protein